MQLSPEEVVEGHSSSLTDGLSTAAVASLRRIHGLNKLEGEVKVLTTKSHIMLFTQLKRKLCYWQIFSFPLQRFLF
jgi:hypothetical protein